MPNLDTLLSPPINCDQGLAWRSLNGPVLRPNPPESTPSSSWELYLQHGQGLGLGNPRGTDAKSVQKGTLNRRFLRNRRHTFDVIYYVFCPRSLPSALPEPPWLWRLVFTGILVIPTIKVGQNRHHFFSIKDRTKTNPPYFFCVRESPGNP